MWGLLCARPSQWVGCAQVSAQCCKGCTTQSCSFCKHLFTSSRIRLHTCSVFTLVRFSLVVKRCVWGVYWANTMASKSCKWNCLCFIDFHCSKHTKRKCKAYTECGSSDPFGDKYLQRYELQVKKHACGWKESPIFMLSCCLCWSGSARDVAVSTWLVSPALASRSRTTQGAEKGGHSFALLRVFCWRGEPDGAIHSGGTEQQTLLGKDPRPSIHFHFPWMVSLSI